MGVVSGVYWAWKRESCFSKQFHSQHLSCHRLWGHPLCLLGSPIDGKDSHAWQIVLGLSAPPVVVSLVKLLDSPSNLNGWIAQLYGAETQ